MRKYKCELCGAESDFADSIVTPNQWRLIGISITYGQRISWDICPVCAKKLSFDKPSTTNEEVLIEAMRNMIAEVAEDSK